MTITLDQHQEQMVLAAIQSGMFRSADEFINAAIATLPNIAASGAASAPPGSARRSRLWDLRQGLALGDVSIKELIEEGRE